MLLLRQKDGQGVWEAPWGDSVSTVISHVAGVSGRWLLLCYEVILKGSHANKRKRAQRFGHEVRPFHSENMRLLFLLWRSDTPVFVLILVSIQTMQTLSEIISPPLSEVNQQQIITHVYSFIVRQSDSAVFFICLQRISKVTSFHLEESVCVSDRCQPARTPPPHPPVHHGRQRPRSDSDGDLLPAGPRLFGLAFSLTSKQVIEPETVWSSCIQSKVSGFLQNSRTPCASHD